MTASGDGRLTSVALLSLLIVPLVGYIEYVKQPELTLSGLYLVPVVAAAWAWGLLMGVSVALICTGLAALAEAKIYEPPSSLFVVLFNDLIGCFRFVIVAVLIAKVRTAIEDIRRREAQRDAAERDLRSFTYAMAHHLRGPLRSIKSGAHVLHSLAPCTPEAGAALRRVSRSTDRMAALIDGLLVMARLNDAKFRRQNVDLSHEAGVVCRRLQEAQRDRDMEITIEETPRVMADLTMVQLLLRILFENAWKFSAGSKRPRICFGSFRRHGQPRVYFVKDTGAGFDMRHCSKLFEAFERLHSPAEFPGLGLGLAVASRIVSRHEGRIWARSQVGRGATFYFTLDR